jgi:hypothetical protein
VIRIAMLIRAWVGPWLASQLNDWLVTAQLSWDPCGFQCTQQKKVVGRVALPGLPVPWALLPFPHCLRAYTYHRRLPLPCLPLWNLAAATAKGREREWLLER